MSSKNPERYLVVLDVGHGSAAILRDEGGVVVFDTGRTPTVSRYCRAEGITDIQGIFLSHADWDHIGGAITLLLDPAMHIRRIDLNPDATKQDVEVFEQLRFAIAEAQKRGTTLYPSLTTGTQFLREGATIEVLYPPSITALAGVGGRDLDGTRLSSNSLSAAIRVRGATNSAILLAGDIGTVCLENWKADGIDPSARALVFPHHGGLAGEGVNDAKTALFAKELSRMVGPKTVAFSIHRTYLSLPRESILQAILEVLSDVRFLCTQLPTRLHAVAKTDPAWELHADETKTRLFEGDIKYKFSEEEIEVSFLDAQNRKDEDRS